MSTISLRLDVEESELIKKYAKANNISVSELLRSAVLEKIYDTLDIAAYKVYLAKAESQKLYTLDEAEAELGL